MEGVVDDTEFNVTRGGMTLRGVIGGDGPEMLYLHGLTGSAATQRSNAPPGYRVAAYDQRGHGTSTPVTEASAFAIEEFVADAIAVLDGLGWDRPAICGTSMGAAVALRLALNHPNRVRALALAAPAFGDRKSAAIERFDGMARAIERFGIADAIPLIRQAQIERGIAPDQTRFLDDFTRHQSAPLVAALRTVGHWVPFQDLGAGGSLPMPVIVLCWPGDEMHPEALAERIAQFARAPLVRLTESVYDVLARPEIVGEALRPLVDDALGAPERRR
jgi:pimeloyl-ACP methyl ester carboxylesterase